DAAFAEDLRDAGTDADLASMYVDSDKKRERGFSIQDGLPPPPPRSFKGLIIGFLVVIFGGLLGTALLVVKLPYVTLQGKTARAPLLQWIQIQVTMPPEQRTLQALDDKIRGYFITESRIQIVYAAAYEYYRTKGTRPTQIGDLIDGRLLTIEQSDDGWGSSFILEERDGEIEIRSAGADGAMRTQDDVRYFNDQITRPPEFENLEFEQTYE
ncbi:hypothetical protein HZA57_07575, partial [Candidatus Poribacteria bacterium]|nr:hypothetical protein [Candidatus Poribacteria bacterium]